MKKDDTDYSHMAMAPDFIDPEEYARTCMSPCGETAATWERIQANFARKIASETHHLLGTRKFPGAKREKKMRKAAYELHQAIDWYLHYTRLIRNEVAAVKKERG